jgi:hypothetical protein
MKIDHLVETLLQIRKIEGNIDVTCTGSTLPDDYGGVVPDVFESTVENLIVGDHKKIGRRVRLYM